MTLTEQELLLLTHHRDMESNGRYGGLTARYKAGQLVEVRKEEVILVPNGNGERSNGSPPSANKK